jgi:TfoX/Sxy family transcriptional regulator of competence genes
MSFDEDLAASVRAALAGAVHEVKMFGGIGFMLNGNLTAAASRRGLLVRVGKDQQHAALARPGARPMVMRGRVMEGYIYVDPPAITADAVRAWIKMALTFVRTLPAKPPKQAKASKPSRPSKAAKSAKPGQSKRSREDASRTKARRK